LEEETLGVGDSTKTGPPAPRRDPKRSNWIRKYQRKHVSGQMNERGKR
jgi:hypothetical protein